MYIVYLFLLIAGSIIYWAIGYLLETIITRDLDQKTFNYVNSEDTNFFFQWLWPIAIPFYYIHKLLYFSFVKLKKFISRH
jgi:hypothetical protein